MTWAISEVVTCLGGFLRLPPKIRVWCTTALSALSALYHYFACGNIVSHSS